jgi:tetratricopeptide (TPR) repeat protein
VEEPEVAQMKHRLAAVILAVAPVFMAPGLQAAADVPPAALRAEMEKRWDDALREYERVLRREPSRADLWLRVADIHAVRKDAARAADALGKAAHLRPDDAALQARLSQANAMADRPAGALAAIRRALELDPENREYLKAQAELAAWNGELALAVESYRRLAEADTRLLKPLARMQARGGDLDAAVKTYGRYQNAHPEDTGALLDYAEVEGYRGNFSKMRHLLERYRARAGETESWRRAMISYQLRSGRPASALAGVDELRGPSTDDYELSLARTLALHESRRPAEALTELETTRRLGPDRPETRGAALQVQTPLRPYAGIGADYYTDHTGIALSHVFVKGASDGTYPLRASFEAGHRHVMADAASGFQTTTGARSATVQDARLGIRSQLTPDLALELGGGVAHFEGNSVNRSLYHAGLDFWTGERLHWTLSSRRVPLAVSPLALERNMYRDEHRLTMVWQPGDSAVIDLRGGWFDYSDGNRHAELELAPRYAAVRTQHHNLDIGLYGQWLGYSDDFSNGYYDPEDFRRYWVTTHYYWKGGENYGFGAVLGLGPERDRALDANYRLGGNLYLGGIIGVYSDWQLRGHAGYGGRLDSAQYSTGTPQGYSVGLELIRRF